MTKLSSPRMMPYRLQLLFNNIFHKLSGRLWSVTWTLIWRQVQRIAILLSQNDEPPMSKSGHERVNSDQSDPPTELMLGPWMPTEKLGQVRDSLCYGSTEPTVRGTRLLESTSYPSHNAAARPYILPAAEATSSDAASYDSSSEFSIHVYPPEHPLNDSRGLGLYPLSQQDETVSVEGWGTSGLSPNLPFSYPASGPLSSNDNRYGSPNSSQSSLKSVAASTVSVRDISRQTFSQQTSGSRVSVTVLPLAQLENDVPERSPFQDSSLEIADHVYSLIPSNLKRYKRKRIM